MELLQAALNQSIAAEVATHLPALPGEQRTSKETNKSIHLPCMYVCARMLKEQVSLLCLLHPRSIGLESLS